jgi:hypothetical protein
VDSLRVRTNLPDGTKVMVDALSQVELAHGKGEDVPRLFIAAGVDPETVVLVNPDAQN